MDKYIQDALKKLKEILPENCTAEYQQIRKNNGIWLDGFIIKEDGNSIAPTFYLSESERADLSPEEFADQLTERFRIEQKRGIDFDIAGFSDFEGWVKDRLMFDVVNRGRNEGSNLANIPITPDLMITFKVSVMPNASIRITNDHLHLWGDVSPEEILEIARQNAVVMDKATFRSIADVIIDMIVEERKAQYPDISEDEFRSRIRNEMFGGIDGMLYVLSTQRQSNAAMLYPDLLEDIRKQLDDDLILLPSSIHEILCMKKEDALNIGLNNVRSMVREVNRDIVMQDNASDFLSDEILMFDQDGLRQIDEEYQHQEEI